ncbi:Hypothetical protein ORPV_230 [Orpheovirus IHUMI-LCC2]|uniref:Uncharacterized protein n=1 Tax=Orpheovirus IHUMI-LCC2 TaxID=2023057 RepID=A0A2I2L3N1_9VIRU|nr:Hypothetical protein ORPV_230 [Orpheovirus IHUMI-LCC2]SNW62134.1 Hypothetical protein ORPV_230 [Orpheovirus IHUMI-LCC2]
MSGRIPNTCNELLSGVIIFYALVDFRIGDDNTGQVGRVYLGLRPFRTLQAAVNELSRRLQGESPVARGQAIILDGPDNVQVVNGDLTIPNAIFVRGGDAAGNITLIRIPTVNVRGTLTLVGNNRFDVITLNATRIVANGSSCGRGVYFTSGVVRGTNDFPFIQIKNGHFGLEDSFVKTSSTAELFDVENSTLVLNSCTISEEDGKIGFDLHNSKAYLSNCNVNLEVDVAVREEGNSLFYITKSDVTIIGDDVVLNDLSGCNECNTEYDRTFINLEVNSIKDINTGNKIKYNFDTFAGNFDGLLNEETAEYSVITDNGIISSSSSKVLRCLTEYVVQISDQYLVFKHSENLTIILPNNAYNGKALSMKFIDVKDRKIKGRFDRNDVEKIKKLDIINLVYINNAWYLM